MNTTDYSDQTPAQIDENLVRLSMKLAREETTVERYSRLLTSDSWKTETQVAKWTETVQAAEEAVRIIEAELDEISTEFTARGGWTRYWMVCNTNGHIHRSAHQNRCSTCYPTTDFTLVFQVSGKSEAEVIDLAGVRVCTVCYKDAPVDVLSRPSRLPYDVADREADEAREAAITPAIVRAARIEAVDILVRLEESDEKDAETSHWIRERLVDYNLIVEALAAMEGTTTEALAEEFAPKVAKKVRANAKAAEKFRAAHPDWFTN